ncbi:MAG: hypothetical protein J2P37_29225 [Ktedonobacteraceae bacterium]|nr:hypothetical protein [Ktedonobacteraceae bacterium]MBO0791349.1 hypothetical protein [Ktedonobacteraceae bacterium]
MNAALPRRANNRRNPEKEIRKLKETETSLPDSSYYKQRSALHNPQNHLQTISTLSKARIQSGEVGMKKLSEDFFSEEKQLDDEFDDLCTRLLHIDPPTTLIERIMHSVHELPPQEADELQEVGLIVLHNGVPPS